LSAQASGLNNDINTGQQVQGTLTSADNALSEVGNWLNSAISIATQGADGSVSTAQMTTLAGQVQSILQQVIGAGNTQYEGQYMFGGNQTTSPPYDMNGNYTGDSNTNFATFSDGTRIQNAFVGSTVLGTPTTGVIGALTALNTALQAGDKTATAATLSQLQTAIQNVATARGVLGVNEQALQNFLTNANNESTTLQGSISNLTDVDTAQAALNEQQAMLQEQALSSMASELGKIPLVDILT
jgi:flagellar hook-associated protein 3 FlgL